jgi:hypothetical protein
MKATDDRRQATERERWEDLPVDERERLKTKSVVAHDDASAICTVVGWERYQRENAPTLHALLQAAASPRRFRRYPRVVLAWAKGGVC